jgi:hypothetical protein
MLYFLLFLLALLTGYNLHDIRELKKIRPEKKPEIGVTNGVYGEVNEFNTNQDGNVGLVETKTPQLLEWEENERLREMQLKVPK